MTDEDAALVLLLLVAWLAWRLRRRLDDGQNVSRYSDKL